jgi:hypothetical protein
MAAGFAAEMRMSPVAGDEASLCAAAVHIRRGDGVRMRFRMLGEHGDRQPSDIVSPGRVCLSTERA